AAVGQAGRDFGPARKDLTSGGGEQKNAPTIRDAVNVLAGPSNNPTRYVVFEKALGNTAIPGPNTLGTPGSSPGGIPVGGAQAVVRSGGASLPNQVFTTTLSGREVPVI